MNADVSVAVHGQVLYSAMQCRAVQFGTVVDESSCEYEWSVVFVDRGEGEIQRGRLYLKRMENLQDLQF